jgi:methionine aminopeptidase
VSPQGLSERTLRTHAKQICISDLHIHAGFSPRDSAGTLKLAYSWRYDGYEGDSLVTFELSEEGSGTHVKVTHIGLETFPAIEAFAPKNFDAGWNAILGTSLKDFVEKG